MHAREITITARLGATGDLIDCFDRSLRPAAQQQPGFVGGLLLTDPPTGKVILLSLWQTEAEMVRGESNGFVKERMAEIRRFAADEPKVHHFAVSAQA
jgi:heme-degrading monooxygenase HmoA